MNRTMRFTCTRTAYGVYGELKISQNGKIDTYDVESLGSQDPQQHQAFRLTKHDGNEYVIGIDVAQNVNHSCECKGFQCRQRCRHVDSVAKLIELGKIS